ncbi:MAG: exosortase A, partial [Alphaproteobacteria bacterium]
MSVQTPKIGLPIAVPPALRVWIPTLCWIAVACAAFGIAFQYEIAAAVRVWDDSTAYNHCYLVLPLVGVLLWMRRDVLAQLRPEPSWWALALLPPASALWLAAALLDVHEAAQLSVVLLFEILLLAVLGWQVFRALLAPLLFLFFLVPFGAFLVPLLQTYTTAFTVFGLQLLGIPVFADGFIIQIPAGTFEVAEACAGLRFLIASIVFGCFFAVVVYRSPWRRAAFIALSIVLPIVANGFRALGLVVLGHILGDAASAMADHIIYGWLFFTIVMLLLIAIGIGFKEDARPSLPRTMPITAAPSTRLGSVTAVGLLLALTGPAYLYWVERASAAPIAAAKLLTVLPQDGAWKREPFIGGDWAPKVDGAEQTTIADYRNGRESVTEIVALYPVPERGNPLTRAAADIVRPEPWRLVETGRASVAVGGKPVSVNTAKIAREDRQRLVWWFYVIDGKPTGSALDAKLLQAATALHGERRIGALVVLSTEMSQAVGPAAAALRDFSEKLR